ncbi:hypothetical protein [Acidipropionibacterium virtanenii]|uniref:Uncharacterized protein n=1 Tax=Acidipropionibacterium virtanenii TaxID=2057246 RepID=A0A344USX9_9ACTN|nr:hypothetical protein [Acidipropionibacterium virtanenii]AXE38377.1 hypothetical protein JS278_01200 [Acidipropionibacterium virtanenii]
MLTGVSIPLIAKKHVGAKGVDSGNIPSGEIAESQPSGIPDAKAIATNQSWPRHTEPPLSHCAGGAAFVRPSYESSWPSEHRP